MREHDTPTKWPPGPTSNKTLQHSLRNAQSISTIESGTTAVKGRWGGGPRPREEVGALRFGRKEWPLQNAPT